MEETETGQMHVEGKKEIGAFSNIAKFHIYH